MGHHITQLHWGHVSFVAFLLIFCTLRGQARPPDPPGSWRELEPATTANLTCARFLDNMHGWVAGTQGTIMKTTDGGLHWNHQQSGASAEIVDLFMMDAQRGWALESKRFEDTSTWYGTTILRTTNGGSTWTSDPPLGIGKYYHRILFADSARGWLCGAYGDLLLTTDGGADWVPASVDSGFRFFWPMYNIRFYSESLGYVMGGTWDLVGLLWKTTDGGHAWSVRQVSPEPVYDLHFQDSLRMVGIVGDLDYGASIIRTTDGGEHWSYRFLGILGLPTALSFRTHTEGWAPLGFAGAFLYTMDGGETWSTQATPHLTAVYDLVFTDSMTGFAVGDSGMILKYIPGTTAIGGQREPTAAGVHSQAVEAYPNPWNSTTIVSYTIETPALVRLVVYDVLGREVLRPLEERQSAGIHRVSVHGDGLATGAYYYTLEVDGRLTVQRFIHLR
jgi:photosystem II stability/assembly factor-like uncharacterized protein